MVDYKLTSALKMSRTPWGSFEEVDGIAEFEQSLGVTIRHQLSDVLSGSTSADVDEERIQLLAHRTAQEFDLIDEVENVITERIHSEDGAYRVAIEYRTAEPFEEVF